MVSKGIRIRVVLKSVLSIMIACFKIDYGYPEQHIQPRIVGPDDEIEVLKLKVTS
jgi:hypothetical protein